MDTLINPPPPPSTVGLNQTEAWVFDLDNTLYPSSCNIFAQIDERMRGFISRFLGLDLEAARAVQKRYFREYGTTLSGLMERHGLEPEEFLAHVHDVDLSPVPPSPELDAALARLPGRKIIFTNADTGHATRVLDRLGIAHHFEAIFDIVAADFVPKPQPVIYRLLIERFGLAPEKTVMLEDIARNLAPAAALGMTTVWVETSSPIGLEGADGDHVHHVTNDLTGWLTAVAES